MKPNFKFFIGFAEPVIALLTLPVPRFKKHCSKGTLSGRMDEKLLMRPDLEDPLKNHSHIFLGA